MGDDDYVSRRRVCLRSELWISAGGNILRIGAAAETDCCRELFGQCALTSPKSTLFCLGLAFETLALIATLDLAICAARSRLMATHQAQAQPQAKRENQTHWAASRADSRGQKVPQPLLLLLMVALVDASRAERGPFRRVTPRRAVLLASRAEQLLRQKGQLESIKRERGSR